MSGSKEEESVLLQVKVLPRSSRNQMAGFENGILKIKLTAPPVDGKANKALRAFLAEILGRPMKDVVIQSGEKGRLKTIRINGVSARDLDRLVVA